MTKTIHAAAHLSCAGRGSSAVEQMAVSADSARLEYLRSDIRPLFKRDILDSLGRAMAGIQGGPFQELREEFDVYRPVIMCSPLTSYA